MIDFSKRNNSRVKIGLGTWGRIGMILALFALFGLGGSASAAPSRPDGGASVAPQLAAQLAAAPDGETVSFLVVLSDQVDAVDFVAGADLSAASRVEKSAALYTALTATARTSQGTLRTWLDQRKIAYRAFYIVNMIEVRATAAQADQIRRFPGIDRLVPNPTVRQALPLPQPTNPPINQSTNQPLPQNVTALTYGLSAIGADKVWALGFRGQGVVVASQDTGVEWTHPALQATYRGWDADTSTASHVYNWVDAWPNDPNRPSACSPDPQVPCDDHGHGTHTVGTLTGTAPTGADFTDIGVAPDAKWMGCRNMDNGNGTPASYTACFEFFLAPYPQGGDPATEGRPDLAPNIINNSWSCPPSEGCDAESLRQIVETVRAAGQLVVSSAGNAGPSCGSVRDPIAIYDAAFSVGAVAENGVIAPFSSRGLADGSGRIKPDLSAPGAAVYSSYVGGGYGYLWGTSMASPHVAGADGVALVRGPGVDRADRFDRAGADQKCRPRGGRPMRSGGHFTQQCLRLWAAGHLRRGAHGHESGHGYHHLCRGRRAAHCGHGSHRHRPAHGLHPHPHHRAGWPGHPRPDLCRGVHRGPVPAHDLGDHHVRSLHHRQRRKRRGDVDPSVCCFDHADLSSVEYRVGDRLA